MSFDMRNFFDDFNTHSLLLHDWRGELLCPGLLRSHKLGVILEVQADSVGFEVGLLDSGLVEQDVRSAKHDTSHELLDKTISKLHATRELSDLSKSVKLQLIEAVDSVHSLLTGEFARLIAGSGVNYLHDLSLVLCRFLIVGHVDFDGLGKDFLGHLEVMECSTSDNFLLHALDREPLFEQLAVFFHVTFLKNSAAPCSDIA